MAGRPTKQQVSAAPRGRELAQLILAESAGAPVGTRLPTERRLAETIGVTRAAVRHALGVLEAEGRISREVGRGTFLREDGAAGDGVRPGRIPSRADDVGPADVMTARELFEPQVVPLVIAQATARDFDEMDRCVAGGDSAESAEEFEAWDFSLHHAIVAAGHNQLLLQIYEAIESARQNPLWGNLKRRNDSGERRAAYQLDHRELVDALRARELDRALEATHAHLVRVRVNLLGSAHDGA